MYDVVDCQARPTAQTVAQVKIDRLGIECGEVGRCVNADVPVGIFCRKICDFWTKPTNAEAGADPKGQIACIPLARDRASGVSDGTEGLGRGLKQTISVQCQNKPSLFAAKKFDAKLLF